MQARKLTVWVAGATGATWEVRSDTLGTAPVPDALLVTCAEGAGVYQALPVT
jgi:hypothetical protein